jgi:hypothetical protein
MDFPTTLARNGEAPVTPKNRPSDVIIGAVAAGSLIPWSRAPASVRRNQWLPVAALESMNERAAQFAIEPLPRVR